MFDRFTDRARKVMALARKEAQRFNHDFISTEHLLLGLIQEGSGVASQVLKTLGVDLPRTRGEVEKRLPPGPSMVTMGQLPFTPTAKRSLELAMEEAGNLGHNYIGTEHLLLALLQESDGVAATVLLDLKINLDVVRNEVLGLLGASEAVDDLENTLHLACEEGIRLQEGILDSSLLLLGLLRDQTGAASRILSSMGVRLEDVQTRIAARRKEPWENPPGVLSYAFRVRRGFFGRRKSVEFRFSALAEKLLGLTKEEANAHNELSITTGDLLLAILQEPSCAAHRILLDLGLKPEEVRSRVLAANPPLVLRFPKIMREELVRAAAFELTDSFGKVRARISLRPDGSPAFELLDANGAQRAVISLDAEGIHFVELRPREGKPMAPPEEKQPPAG